MIPLSIPHLAGNEWNYVKECLDTGWVSTAGAYVGKFENAIAEFTGSLYAISCMNGTAGLHTAMNLLGIGSGDYVIAPNLTFVATLNAISYTKAEPLLLDIDPEDWQMDLDLLQRFLEVDTYLRDTACYLKKDDRRIAAIMPVHVLGNMCDMDRLAALADRYHLPVIEDSTEALGSTFRGRHAGTFGIFGTSSFNGNKIITTGGGGMILTQDEKLAAHAKHLTTTAKTDPMDYFHDEVGYNYRLVNVLAAIGLAQMEQLPGLIERKKHMDAFYRKRLDGVGDISFQRVTEGVDPNCWLFTFRTRRMRELLNYLNKRGVQSRPFWTPMNQLPMYRSLPYYTQSDHAAQVHATAISIPSSSGLTDGQLQEVVDTIKEFYRN
ncbi:LegC family aminotransferase [Neolewinella litorea]|uniref:LegC family aminotransferase n=1 Tax=Neolewinella litorea TaxID=2562452 RepID=A0A4S4N890_9BACT|nr:LegC family aminotransferase [Neolewinella litorea]THH34557.1 LegC family aminotransferase [Neolewinella litorea]